jgi:hypothetical protein
METAASVTLYRPVGRLELDLIAAAGFRAFPSRLPHQPIFYPVLHEAYAVEIASRWNTRDAASGFAGFVTRFQVAQAFLARYTIQRVGGLLHEEYWIPAEDLDDFNASLVGPIEVTAEFRSTPPAGRESHLDLNRE